MQAQSIQELFRAITTAISNRDDERLKNLTYSIPEHFNWVRDIFEPLYAWQIPDNYMRVCG